MKMAENVSELARQYEVVISLLGRIAFPGDKVRDLVTRGKRNPEKYVQGYNACDGTKTVRDLAQVIGVQPPTLSPILAQWEAFGIVYSTEQAGGRFYKKLFQI